MEDFKKLGQLLLEQGVISADELQRAVQEQETTGLFIGEILVSQGAADEVTIAKSLSSQLGFAYVDLSQVSIEPEAIRQVPEEMCRRLNAMPLYSMNGVLTIAMANPLDVLAVDELHASAGMRVKAIFSCYSMIRKAIEKHYKAKDETLPSVPQANYKSFPTDTRVIQSDKESADDLQAAANLASVIETVDEIISQAVSLKASDIHLDPGKDNLKCRYRTDGILQSPKIFPKELQPVIISRIKIMADLDIAEKRLPQDGRIRMNLSGQNIDLRISTFPTLYGESLVIRILNQSNAILTLEELGFAGDLLDTFRQLIKRPYGMILVTGPTGSGKTSTLYASLSEINSEEKNIITLEDPVEYEIAGIRQSQVNMKAGLTFASGLRSIVRQDPDVIMIGEIRDKETADIAIHAALTGHLVFATLHTNDAPSAATRLVDMGVEPFLVSSSVIGILAQRLIRNLCPLCKKLCANHSEIMPHLGLKNSKSKRVYKFYEETGCLQCQMRGYSGRRGIFELMIPDENIRSLIARNESASVVKAAAIERGMRTLREYGMAQVCMGDTSLSEILRVTEVL